MNEALSDAPRSSSSPDPETVKATAAATPPWSPSLSQAPPLSGLSAIAALAAMMIGQLIVPALSDPSRRELLFTLDRYGDFATNLAAITGLIALGFGLYSFVRHSDVVGLRQRLLIGTFALIFLPTIAFATLFERQRTTTQIVLFALGAAYVLGAQANAAAARARGGRFPRVLAIVAAAMAMLTLVAQLLQLMTQTRLNVWAVQAFEVILSLGELCYLGLLIGFAPLVLPLHSGLRDRLGRSLSFFVLPVLLGGMYYAERVLEGDYTLLLYHAQRVSLFIDEWPRLYVAPIAISLAAALGGSLSSEPSRRQGAAGLCLLVSSGFSPHAPGRLLSLALALVLIARTIVGPLDRRAVSSSAPARP